jgi:hypothetical protein
MGMADFPGKVTVLETNRICALSFISPLHFSVAP